MLPNEYFEKHLMNFPDSYYYADYDYDDDGYRQPVRKNWHREIEPLLDHLRKFDRQVALMLDGRFTTAQFYRVRDLLCEKILINTVRVQSVSLNCPRELQQALTSLNPQLVINVRKSGVLPSHFIFRKSGAFHPIILEDVYRSVRFPKEVDARFASIYTISGERKAVSMHPYRSNMLGLTKKKAKPDKEMQIDRDLMTAGKVLSYAWTDDQTLLFILADSQILDLRHTLCLIEMLYVILFRFWERMWCSESDTFTPPLQAMGRKNLALLVRSILVMSSAERQELHALAARSYDQLQKELVPLLDKPIKIYPSDDTILMHQLLYAQYNHFDQVDQQIKLREQPGIADACSTLEESSHQKIAALLMPRPALNTNDPS
ncbi:MAG: hypothetical protein HKN87_19870 [Saprospiraceae bacterium]|nr:hypothetical protein [Saprospiraceae bacterium]